MTRAIYIICMLLSVQIAVNAQPPPPPRPILQPPPVPPRPIAIFASPDQGLIFGTFFRGNTGGTITVFPDGSRSVTGDLVQSNIGVPFSPAIFEIEANQGTIISILNGSDAILNGNNGGSVTLKLGTSSPGSPFITSVQSPSRTIVKIGGTLIVGGALASPSGSYSGNFYVTFIQQ